MMRIVVCMKQVPDPLTPISSLQVDEDRVKIRGPANTPPVINGFDEQALEAALRLQDEWQGEEACEITVLSAGEHFALDVLKRALPEGVDDLVLVRDPALETWDAYLVARALAAAIRHVGGADLVLCGRQASDWDNAQVPLLIAEMLGWACLTVARAVEVDAGRVRVERVLRDGIQEMEAELPAVVTVTSELGELRYPSMRARLQAARRRPRQVSLQELGVDTDRRPRVDLLDLSLVQEERDCRFVEGADGAERGRRLAEQLVTTGLVDLNGVRR